MTNEQKLTDLFSQCEQIRYWIGHDRTFLALLLEHPELIQRLSSAIDDIEDIYNVLHIAEGTTRSHTIEDDGPPI